MMLRTGCVTRTPVLVDDDTTPARSRFVDLHVLVLVRVGGRAKVLLRVDAKGPLECCCCCNEPHGPTKLTAVDSSDADTADTAEAVPVATLRARGTERERLAPVPVILLLHAAAAAADWDPDPPLEEPICTGEVIRLARLPRATPP